MNFVISVYAYTDRLHDKMTKPKKGSEKKKKIKAMFTFCLCFYFVSTG